MRENPGQMAEFKCQDHFKPCILDFKGELQLPDFVTTLKGKILRKRSTEDFSFSLVYMIWFIWTEQRIKENLCKLLEFERALPLLLKIPYIVLGTSHMCEFAMSLIFLIPDRFRIIKSKYSQKIISMATPQ